MKIYIRKDKNEVEHRQFCINTSEGIIWFIRPKLMCQGSLHYKFLLSMIGLNKTAMKPMITPPVFIPIPVAAG